MDGAGAEAEAAVAEEAAVTGGAEEEGGDVVGDEEVSEVATATWFMYEHGQTMPSTPKKTLSGLEQGLMRTMAPVMLAFAIGR